MSHRPEFPQPYCILPPECIDRINQDQEWYDRNPESAERWLQSLEDAREEERRQEAEYEAYLLEQMQKEQANDEAEVDNPSLDTPAE